MARVALRDADDGTLAQVQALRPTDLALALKRGDQFLDPRLVFSAVGSFADRDASTFPHG